MKTLVRSLAVFGLLAVGVHAQTTIYWNFMGGNGIPTIVPPNLSVTANLFGNNEQPGNNPLFDSVSQSGGYTGVNGPASGIHNASIGIVGGALDPVTSTYFEFTVAPDPGLALTATDLEFGTFSTLKGPLLLTFMASTDGFATSTNLGSIAVVNNSTWALVSLPTFNYSATTDTPITFRIYGSNGIGGAMASNWRIDDVSLGITAAVPEPSTYASLLIGVVLLGARALRRRKSAVA
jgi:hypothetical protein